MKVHRRRISSREWLTVYYWLQILPGRFAIRKFNRAQLTGVRGSMECY
jgi:hypothetical protein